MIKQSALVIEPILLILARTQPPPWAHLGCHIRLFHQCHTLTQGNSVQFSAFIRRFYCRSATWISTAWTRVNGEDTQVPEKNTPLSFHRRHHYESRLYTYICFPGCKTELYGNNLISPMTCNSDVRVFCDRDLPMQSFSKWCWLMEPTYFYWLIVNIPYICEYTFVRNWKRIYTEENRKSRNSRPLFFFFFFLLGENSSTKREWDKTWMKKCENGE